MLWWAGSCLALRFVLHAGDIPVSCDGIVSWEGKDKGTPKLDKVSADLSECQMRFLAAHADDDTTTLTQMSH